LGAFTVLAQKSELVKTWHPGPFLFENIALIKNEDLAKQINILDIRETKKENNYSGWVVYGKGSLKNPRPSSWDTAKCDITINGKNISIVTTNKSQDIKWSGTFINGANFLDATLGSLTYNFTKFAYKFMPPSSPKSAYRPEQFYGKWLETGRVNVIDNSPLTISNDDIMYMNITKDSAIYYEGNNAVPQPGIMEIKDGDHLYMPAQDFKIISVTNQSIVLFDLEKKNHILTRSDKPFPVKAANSFCSNCAVDLSSAMLINNWFAKGISPKLASMQKNAIASMKIISKKDENIFLGEISFGNWNDNNPVTEPCTFSFSGHNLSIEAKTFSWKGLVYQSDGKTLIFGKTGEIMYTFEKTTSPENINTSQTGVVNIDIRPETLMHNWKVYSADAIPGYINSDSAIIRGINITENTGKGYKGKVTYDQHGKRNIVDCIIQISGSQENGFWMNIAATGVIWNIELFSVDTNEMILGKKSDHSIRYALKY
jgi:hypothetical protein